MSRYRSALSVAGLMLAVAPALASPPTIDVWYGTHQQFGQLGRNQQWVNILGNVSDPDGVTSLTYSLNDGPPLLLRRGPDTRRLENAGDFNADIDADQLVDGLNEVVLTARDSLGNIATQTVTIENTHGAVWPEAFVIDWSAAAAMEDVAQVIDGLWTHDALGLRTVEVGYDRIVGLGDVAWDAYEVTVPLTVHSIDPSGFEFPSVAPGVGMVMRWRGHTDYGGNWQPIYGWTPNGATFWYDYGAADGGQFRITGDHGLMSLDPNDHEIVLDTTYMLKMRVEPIAEDAAMYRAKVWPAGNPEPAGWAMQGIDGPGDLASGSLLLIAHHVDATFGNVTVTPLENPNPPVIVNIFATATQSDATVRWSTGEPATTEIAWGVTPALELGTFSDPVLKQAHQVQIPDLPPGTLFYYQITAVDESEAESESDTLTFVTRGPGAEFVSDDFFSQPTLNEALWTFVDPRGDSALALTGRQLAIDVPAGLTHDVWSNGINAARVMQAVKDIDFEVEVKFDSVVSQRYQGQGILVQEDADTVLRFDVFSTGNGAVRAFAAHINGASAAIKINAAIASDGRLRMRVTRTGSTWQMQWSNDGQAWNTAGSFSTPMVVSGIGVFASNTADAGQTPPAHTALIDYAFNTGSPIVPEDGGLYELTLSVVGNGTVMRDPNQPLYDANTPVTLTATPAPGWEFTGWSGALSGADNPAVLALMDDSSVTATFSEHVDDDPPVISDVTVTPSHQAVTFTWTTDEPASTGYLYGLTEDYELGGDEDLTPATSHSVTITGLAPNHTYHFLLFSADANTNVGTHPGQFQTGPPPVSNLVSDDFSDEMINSSLWTFVDPIGDCGLAPSGAHAVISAPAEVEHFVWVGGNFGPRLMQACNDADFEVEVKFDTLPTQGFQYHGLIIEQDAENFIRINLQSDGSGADVFAATFLKGTPSIRIFDPLASLAPQWLRVQRAGATWTVTYSYNGLDWLSAGEFNFAMQVTAVGPFAGNESDGAQIPAFMSAVDYFFNTAAPVVPEDGGDHTLTLTVFGQGSVQRDPNQALYAPGTPLTLTATPAPGWSFAGWGGSLGGADNPLNVNINADILATATFVENDVTAPAIGNVAVNPTARSAMITFTTDEPADARVEYGLTPALELGSVPGGSSQTSHAILLTGLDPQTEYHYQVFAADATLNESSAPAATFTTDAVVPSSLVSDDFSETSLDPIWTFVDPLGDAALTLDGAFASIAVPADVQHDAWVTGALAPRLVQSANDTDFEAIVRFESLLSEGFQSQGLLAEEDADAFVRVNLHHSGAAVFLFAATIRDGQAVTHVNRNLGAFTPSHLRVIREDHFWMIAYSFDGENWSEQTPFVSAIELSAVSVFGGNAMLRGNPAPAHTALIDFFLNPNEVVDPDCPGDCNGDGERNIADLGDLLATFNMEPGACDLDGSGRTDITDLGAVLSSFNQPCP